MEEIIKKLKKALLGKEVALAEMNNKVHEIAGDLTSILGIENECIKDGYCAYEFEIGKDILIYFKVTIINKEDISKTIVKVTNIEG